MKIRCSAIGKIMTGELGLTTLQANELAELEAKFRPTEKQSLRAGKLRYKRDNPELSQTTKTYIEQLLKEQIYNTKHVFTSKYTDKGNIVEDNSIDFVAEQLGYGMLIKNETPYENDFLTGTPDVITKDTVIDLKNSWDCFTYPLFSDIIPNNDYMYQLQGYMALTGLKKAKLIYVLSDTPTNLIEKEAYFYCKNMGYDEMDMDIYKEFEQRMTYKDIPNDLKIKVFEFSYDADIIKSIYERINLCQIYEKLLLTKVCDLVKNLQIK